MRALLPPADAAIAIAMAATIGAVAIELKAKRISIARLSALMFGAATEKTAKVTGAAAFVSAATKPPNPIQGACRPFAPEFLFDVR